MRSTFPAGFLVENIFSLGQFAERITSHSLPYSVGPCDVVSSLAFECGSRLTLSTCGNLLHIITD